MDNRTIIISEDTVEQIKRTILREAFHPERKKVLAIKDFLDSTFKPSFRYDEVDGYPSRVQTAELVSNGETLKVLSMRELLLMLDDKFNDLIKDTEDRRKFLKQVITDWYGGKISKEGLLSLNTIAEGEEETVIYTAQAVDDPDALEAKYPSELPNKYYHHSTNRFGSQVFDEREGEKMRLRITGRLTTDKVDVLTVDNPNSDNEIPHITLATAEGVRPVMSNSELQQYSDDIEPLDDTVDTTFKNFMKRR